MILSLNISTNNNLNYCYIKCFQFREVYHYFLVITKIINYNYLFKYQLMIIDLNYFDYYFNNDSYEIILNNND